MESICKCHLRDFAIDNNLVTGYVEEDEEFNKFIEHLNCKGYDYYSRSSTDYSKCKHYIKTLQLEHDYFKVSDSPKKLNIKFFKDSGVPFYHGKTKYMECVHGGSYRKSTQDPGPGKKKRFHVQPTKKLNCPSFMKVREKIVFTEQKYVGAGLKARAKKEEVVKEIRARSKEPNDKPPTSKMYFVEIMVEHNHDITVLHLDLDKEIIKRIEELVQMGVTDILEVKKHLNQKVKDMFHHKNYVPEENNTKYFPSTKTIYSHIYYSLFTNKSKNIDQESLIQAVTEWHQENDSIIYFRPFTNTESEPLLFVYQSEWQRDLIKEYGNNLCLLETIYKTTSTHLPLFLIMVKANLRFIPGGLFLCMTESSENIKEALDVLLSWNPDWKPEDIIVDVSESEMHAVNEVFPETQVQMCPSQREQVWLQWTKKLNNTNKSNISVLLKQLKVIANSNSVDEFVKQLDLLRDCELYTNNQQVREYIEDQWLSRKTMWVKCFTNNTYEISEIERQNNILRENFLTKSDDTSLTGILRTIIKQYFPDAYSSYNTKNLNTSLKKYNEEVPQFLHNRPIKFVKHVMKCLHAAKVEFCKNNFLIKDDKTLVIASGNKSYTLDFSTGHCTCEDFKRFKSLCKHFCAAFLYMPGYAFDDLPLSFINNPLYSLQKRTIINECRKSLPENTTVCNESLPESITECNESLPESITECNESLPDFEDCLRENWLIINNGRSKEKQTFCDLAKETVNLSLICEDLALVTTATDKLQEVYNILKGGNKRSLGDNVIFSKRKKC